MRLSVFANRQPDVTELSPPDPIAWESAEIANRLSNVLMEKWP